MASELTRVDHVNDDVDPEDRQYWLPAMLGTAGHAMWAERAPGDALAEQRVPVGTLEGYGTITGSCDVFFPAEKTCWDYKTTERAKLKLYRKVWDQPPDPSDTGPLQMARFTIKKYTGQLMLYGRGWKLLGYDVDWCSIVFICRDGKTDSDVWAKDLKYDRAYADGLWARAQRIWLDMQGGKPLESMLSKTACWSCTTSGEPRKWSKKPY